MMQLMQQKIQQIAQSQQQWTAALQQGLGVNHQPPPTVVGNPTFREYNWNHPLEFDGNDEPPEANRWIKYMENKVIFATNKFRGPAQDWWETAQRRMGTNGTELN
jgi:hypothetical protein